MELYYLYPYLFFISSLGNYYDLSINVKKILDIDEEDIIKIFIFERAKIQNIIESKIYWFEKGALSTYLSLFFLLAIIVYRLLK